MNDASTYEATPVNRDTEAVRASLNRTEETNAINKPRWRKRSARLGGAAEQDPAEPMTREPGLGMVCADWPPDQEVAAIYSDNWGIGILSERIGGEVLNVHMVLISNTGMTLGETLGDEQLSTGSTAHGIDELFCAPLLKFANAVGSPINPLPVK